MNFTVKLIRKEFFSHRNCLEDRAEIINNFKILIIFYKIFYATFSTRQTGILAYLIVEVTLEYHERFLNVEKSIISYSAVSLTITIIKANQARLSI